MEASSETHNESHPAPGESNGAGAPDASGSPGVIDTPSPSATPQVDAPAAPQNQQPAGEQAKNLEIPGPPALSDDADPAEVLKAAGLEASDIVTQWADNGKLTDEQYAKLTKVIPVPRSVIDAYIKADIAAATASQQATMQKAAEIAGGEEALDSMLEWASNALTPTEREWFNDQAKTANGTTAAVEWLAGKYQRANPEGPQTGGSAAQQSTAPFANDQELAAAMSDPRYGPTTTYGGVNPNYDEAYTDSVRRRMKAMV